MANVPGFIKITRNYGFNYLVTPLGEVERNDELFLRRNGSMISLGTYNEAQARIGGGRRYVLGIDGTNYGDFGTPEIDDNLFILAKSRLPPPPGQRDISSLRSLARQTLSSAEDEAFRVNVPMIPPNKITYSDGSNQNAGKFRSRKSRSRKSHSRKSRSRKSRSRKSRSRKSHSRKSHFRLKKK